MNNKPRRTIITTVILIALSLTGIAAFAMTHGIIANGLGATNDSGTAKGPRAANNSRDTSELRAIAGY